MSTASDEHRMEGVDQINQAVTQMDLTTRHNAVLLEEMAAVGASLSQQAHGRVETVAQFKRPGLMGGVLPLSNGVNRLSLLEHTRNSGATCRPSGPPPQPLAPITARPGVRL